MNTAKSKSPAIDTVDTPRNFTSQSLLTAAAVFAICGLFLYHFYIVWTYAVDVPYRDEWDTLHPNGLSSHFSLDWLLSWHNEHRLVTTKLLVWTLYQLNGWDLAVHQSINFWLYGLLLFTIAYWAHKRETGLGTWAIVAFLVFLLSPLIYENHLMGYQSQIHFALLFFVAALYFLFDDAQQWWSLLLGSAMAVLSVYSLSSGIATSAVLLILFVLFKLRRSRSGREDVQRSQELLQAGVVGAIIVVAIGLWFIGYQKPPDAPPNALPFTGIFWNYFLNIVAFGFGIETLSPWPGLLCLAIVLLPVVGDIVKRRAALPAVTWGTMAGILGILSVLAIIAMGRAIGFGIEQSKSSRYAEIGMLLIPLSAMAWSSFLHDKPRWKTGVLTTLWYFCFAMFFHTWSYFSIYQTQFTERTAGIQCVERYYNGQGRGNCRALYPTPIPDRLDQARKLNLSFYRAIVSGQTDQIAQP